MAVGRWGVVAFPHGGLRAHRRSVTREPAFDVVDRDGRRTTIHPAGPLDTVGDLARALGGNDHIDVRIEIRVDGTHVEPGVRLRSSGVCHGSQVDVVTIPSSVPSRTPSADSRSASGPRPTPTGQGPAPGTEVVERAVEQPVEMVEVAVVAGPACTRWMALHAGRHQIGRAPTAAVRIDDPAAEPHLGVATVDHRGAVTFAQLTGRTPVRVGGRPIRGSTTLGHDDTLEAGACHVALRRPVDRGVAPVATGTVVDDPTSPWRRTLHRGANAQDARGDGPEIPEIPVPPPERRPPPATGLVGAGVAVIGGAVMAALLDQLLMALFGVVGAVAAAGTWAAGWISCRRAGRADRIGHARAVDEFRDAMVALHDERRRIHEDRHLAVSDVLADLERVHGGGPTAIWSRRLQAADPLVATLGPGTDRWPVPLDADDRRRLTSDLDRVVAGAERLDGVSVPLVLEAGSVVALRGGRHLVEALCRSILVQLAARHGPADWNLAVLTDRPDDWQWATWLPHGAEGRVHVVTAGGDRLSTEALVGQPGARLLLVTDTPAALATRTSPLRRLLATSDTTCLAVVDGGDAVPAVCDRVVEVGSTGRIGAAIAAAGITADTAARAARRLAALVDPEASVVGDGLDTDLRIGDLHVDLLGDRPGRPPGQPLGQPPGHPAGSATAGNDAEPTGVVPDPARIARQWAGAGHDPPPAATIGASADGLVEIDLVRDGPHGLVAGTTGSGKSELLRTLVLALAARVSPAHLTFVLVDYKGGATFDACARLPHTVGCVTDLDDGLAQRALVSLDAEVLRRERLLRDAGVDDLAGYRRSRPGEPLPRLAVVVDEFATLARELPDFLTSLVAVAQRGRSLGVHLLLATQRPAGVVTDDIRANTNLRIALRLTDTADATDVVGDPAPARISRSRPGRAVLRLGPDELVEFQAASCSGPARRAAGRPTAVWSTTAGTDTAPAPSTASRSSRPAGTQLPADTSSTELEQWVAAIRAATRSAGIADPRRPWIEPLPHPLERATSSRLGVGLVDDPARQCRSPLRWTPGCGNLRLVGSVGAGTTTALLAVATDQCSGLDPAQLHLYVVDGRGDERLDALEAVAHCGAVIRLTEHERVDRLLRRLAGELDRRTSTGERAPAVTLLVDGLDAVRSSLATVDRAAAAERFARILANGPDAGISVCFTVDGGSPAAIGTPAAETWLFHTADPTVARSLGISGSPVPAGLPGRLIVASSGLTAQVAADADDPSGLPTRAGTDVGAGPDPVRVLPHTVDPERIDEPVDGAVDAAVVGPPGGLVRLPIGVGADDLRVDALELAPDDHVLVAGASRTGTSTALRQVAFAWRRLLPDGRVVTVSPRTELTPDRLPPPPALLVVDDADRVDDPTGVLAAIAAARHPGITIAAAGRIEALRAAYGHWTRDVARSRCGLVMTATGDVDGDLLGVTLPRRSLIPARPGLGWLVDRRGHRLVQVAARLPV